MNAGGPVLAKIYVTLKRGVLDPQGQAVGRALGRLGFAGVEDVRVGKYLELRLPGADRAAAQQQVDAMCRELIANTVIEDYRFELEE
jgi:phosphoribosylformylglycinamidine synthase PurS subunit